MTNRTKIIIGIIIVILIVAMIFGVVKNIKVNNNETKKQDEFSNVFDYLNEINEEENQINDVIENNTIEENITSETEKNEVNNVQNSNNDAVIGKEEQESNKENKEINNKEKAIELAKKEWAISIESYDFQAELQGDGKYVVKVINKTNRNEVTRYTVDVKAESVIEAE